MFDVLIRNARIVDGTGAPWIRGDIGIVKDEITAMDFKIEAEAAFTVDAQDMIVAPGFIDTHAHSDLRILKHPEEDYKIQQGITTCVLAPDGLSVAPITDDTERSIKQRVAGLYGTYVQDWTWRTISDYLTEIEKNRPATNNLMSIAHGNVRAIAMGWDSRPPTTEELKKMRNIVQQGFDDGAGNLSTALILPPALYAGHAELVALTHVAAENGGFFAVHMRNESDTVVEALQEMIDVCKESGCPLHISHLKVGGKRNWGKSQEILNVIDQARLEGMDVTFDQYPYIAGCTMLDAVIPPWVHEGGIEKFLERLEDSTVREKIQKDLEGPSDKWENWVGSCGWEGVVITSVGSGKNKSFEGKSISKLAGETGKRPLDVVADLLIEEENAVTMTVFYGDENDVETIMQHPCLCVCTDGIMGGKPHPRVYGTFPRILGHYVRERKILTLENAIQRMTGNPSRLLRLNDRGILRKGMKADITIFDQNKIIDVGTYENPDHYPAGIEYVFVNGEVALEKGNQTAIRSGKVLRRRN